MTARAKYGLVTTITRCVAWCEDEDCEWRWPGKWAGSNGSLVKRRGSAAKSHVQRTGHTVSLDTERMIRAQRA